MNAGRPPIADRRRFLLASAASLGGLSTGLHLSAQTLSTPQSAPTPAPAATPGAAKPKQAAPLLAPPYDRATINLIGPKPGYSPMVGVLVSQLTWMELALVRPTRDLSVADLDYLLDAHANSIGALMLHTVAAEVFYQRNTFNNEPWGKFPADITARYDDAMELGDKGRSSIKGHDWSWYIDQIRTVRQHTLDELAKRDDAWLLQVDKDWPWGPTNNFCKWFHVTEHISHHAGQIDLLLSRLPGAKSTAAGG